MGKAFEKQIKTIEDQSQKQSDALENLKRKEERKPIEDKSNNQSKLFLVNLLTKNNNNNNEQII